MPCPGATTCVAWSEPYPRARGSTSGHTAPGENEKPCYRVSYGMRMGRIPVRSGLLFGHAISTSEGVETS
jgi:hypothetical protein